jgi:hypothetical protein
MQYISWEMTKNKPLSQILRERLFVDWCIILKTEYIYMCNAKNVIKNKQKQTNVKKNK